MLFPYFLGPTEAKHHLSPCFLVSAFLVFLACYTQSIPIASSVWLCATVSGPPLMAAPIPVWVIPGLLSLRYAIAFGMECQLPRMSHQVPVSSAFHVSLCISSHLLPLQLVLTHMWAGVLCAALAAFGVWEAVHMGFRARCNRMARGGSWLPSVQVISAASAT